MADAEKHYIEAHAQEGMTLRDYFAGQVLASGQLRLIDRQEIAAAQAYRVADAMLAARKATP